MTLHNTTVSEGFEVVARNLQHPTNPTATGDLWRNLETDVYVLACAGSLVSVPQDWALDLDVSLADQVWTVQHAAAELGRRGGQARKRNLSTTQRRDQARHAAHARWSKRCSKR